MPDDPKRVYWDSNVFIHYFEGTPDRIDLLTQFIEKVVRDDSRKIFTSTLTITEVAFLGSERGGLSSDSEQIIDQLWNDDRIIAFIEPHEIIMRDARALIRKCIELSIKTLKPPDAIHIASAMALKVDEINTYDIKTWAKYEEMTGYEIREPHILDPRLFP